MPSWFRRGLECKSDAAISRIPFPAILLFSLLFAAWGCAGTAVRDPAVTALDAKDAHFISSVPFFPQEEYQCGPAALASVLNHLGDNISPEAIAQAIFRDETVRGTLFPEMVLFARKRGFSSRWGNGKSGGELIALLERDIPVIVMVDEGMGVIQQLHFMVVTGYDRNGLRAHSGRTRDKRISWRLFLKKWDLTDNLYIVTTTETDAMTMEPSS